MRRTAVMILPTYRFNPYQRLLGAALERQGLDVTVVGDWPRRTAILGAWQANGRPEIVHLHWIHDFLGGSRGRPSRRNVRWFDWQLRILRMRGVRIVWTVHNLKGHEGQGDAREIDAHKRLIERCDAIIVHCAKAREMLIDMYRPSEAARRHIRVVAHGSYVGHYATDLPRDRCREELELPADGRIFAFVGAIRGYKNVGELLDAFMSLDEVGANDRLVVAGMPLPKRLGKELERLADGDPRIVLRLGRQTEEELSVILRAADVAVTPFRDILTSGSAILALSHGRPVIAPAMGCLPQTLPEEASILYPPDAPDGLAEAMRAALDADLPAMGDAALEDAKRLDWDTIAAETAELYRGT